MRKILYIHQYFAFPTEKDGTRSYDISMKLLEAGFQVEVLSATSNPVYKTKHRWCKVEKDGLTVNYIYLPYDNTLSAFRRILVFLSFLWFSSIKTLRIKTDMVLATSTPLTIGIPAIIKSILHKTPYVFEVRDVWPEAVAAIGAIRNKMLLKLLYKLEYITYKKAEYIVPLSVDMKQSILSRYPQFMSKIQCVIENISEINRFQKGYDNKLRVLERKIGFKPRFTVLYAGTFGRVNNIEYVVNLAEHTIKLDPSIVFVLIGEGAQKQSVLERSKGKGLLNKNIFILEAVAKNELPQLYYEVEMGSSFVANIKELWANSANKFFDTLAAGRPVLINHGGWQSDVIKKKNTGYVLPSQVNLQVAVDFVNYTKKTDLILVQRANALHLAETSYSLEIASDKYLSVLNKVYNK